MTADEFNNKWKDHLETGHYGMSIEIQGVVEFMDSEFEKEVLVNPAFTFSQIKRKYGMARVYTSSDKDSMWELVIDEILKYLGV